MTAISNLSSDARRALRFEARARSFDLGKPLVMGILNVTPDSFSDGGLYLDPGAALDRALEIEREGADILDMGAESTRPGAGPVEAREEIARLAPALERIVPKLRIPVSVDTYKAEVMRAALDLGASIVNDVSGLRGEGAAAAVAAAGAGVIVMHMRGTPQTMQADTRYADLLGEVEASLRRSVGAALEAGVARERLMVDPGIGFGKSFEDNFSLIGGIGRLKAALGLPVLVGVSRKGFLRRIAGEDPGALRAAGAACHALALRSGADVLRAHDVLDARRTVDMFLACGGRG